MQTHCTGDVPTGDTMAVCQLQATRKGVIPPVIPHRLRRFAIEAPKRGTAVNANADGVLSGGQRRQGSLTRP